MARPHRDRESPLSHSFFLFGAGASADAGVPMSRTFVDRIAGHLRGLPDGTNDAAVAELERVRDYLRSRTGREPGLEAVYECMDDALDGRFETSSVSFKTSRALERVHYEIKRVIQNECVVDDVGRHAFLTPLFRRLRRFAPYPIVSLNYDDVVERRSGQCGLRVAEAVTGERTSSCDIELVKIHGSVTWMPRAGGMVERIGNRPGEVVRRLGEVRSPILETPMIYPSRRKMPMYGPFMRNALRFQELLADPKYRLCIVVGYSFPDAHVRSWIGDALKARPELKICLVGPTPELPDEALDNLTRNLTVTPWTDRLSIVKADFKSAVGSKPDDFESTVAAAVPFGRRVAFGSVPAIRRIPARSIYSGRVSGLAASADGRYVFIADPADKRVLKHDLERNRLDILASHLLDPRGIAVAPDGDILVVQNAALPLGRFTPRGVGTVVAISRNGRSLKTLGPGRPHPAELIALTKRLRAGLRGDALWSAIRSLLRWPTDVAALPDGSVFVTEARALVKISYKAPPLRVCEPPLAFNLHALDAVGDTTLVGVEEGVAHEGGWGRAALYHIEAHPVTYTYSAELEGLPRLMGLCFVPPLGCVVVTQSLTWPYGRLIVVDYPALSNARSLAGFDLPGNIAFVPGRNMLAVATRSGLELLPIDVLAQARPLRGLRFS
ncbi:MAG TPA: hypothetical protein VGD01_06625 [Candidatus Elarobacter sp.]|jgi:hypothetical protein